MNLPVQFISQSVGRFVVQRRRRRRVRRDVERPVRRRGRHRVMLRRRALEALPRRAFFVDASQLVVIGTRAVVRRLDVVEDRVTDCRLRRHLVRRHRVKVRRKRLRRLLDLHRTQENIFQGESLELLARVPGLGFDAVVAAAAAAAPVAAAAVNHAAFPGSIE